MCEGGDVAEVDYPLEVHYVPITGQLRVVVCLIVVFDQYLMYCICSALILEL